MEKPTLVIVPDGSLLSTLFIFICVCQRKIHTDAIFGPEGCGRYLGHEIQSSLSVRLNRVVDVCMVLASECQRDVW